MKNKDMICKAVEIDDDTYITDTTIMGLMKQVVNCTAIDRICKTQGIGKVSSSILVYDPSLPSSPYIFNEPEKHSVTIGKFHHMLHMSRLLIAKDAPPRNKIKWEIYIKNDITYLVENQITVVNKAFGSISAEEIKEIVKEDMDSIIKETYDVVTTFVKQNTEIVKKENSLSGVLYEIVTNLLKVEETKIKLITDRKSESPEKFDPNRTWFIRISLDNLYSDKWSLMLVDLLMCTLKSNIGQRINKIPVIMEHCDNSLFGSRMMVLNTYRYSFLKGKNPSVELVLSCGNDTNNSTVHKPLDSDSYKGLLRSNVDPFRRIPPIDTV